MDPDLDELAVVAVYAIAQKHDVVQEPTQTRALLELYASEIGEHIYDLMVSRRTATSLTS